MLDLTSNASANPLFIVCSYRKTSFAVKTSIFKISHAKKIKNLSFKTELSS